MKNYIKYLFVCFFNGSIGSRFVTGTAHRAMCTITSARRLAFLLILDQLYYYRRDDGNQYGANQYRGKIFNDPCKHNNLLLFFSSGAEAPNINIFTL